MIVGSRSDSAGTSHSTKRMPAVDRRRQLLEAAIDLFSQNGFAGTTTKEIAAAAGVTEAIIFRHFATKQQLYTAIIDLKLQSGGAQEWLAETRACMERNDDAGLFRTIAKKIIDLHRNDPRFERLMLYAGLEGHELATIHHQQLAIPIAGMLGDYILRRQREGALVDLKPSAILFAIAGMAQHYAWTTQIFGCPGVELSDDEAIEGFMQILMGGILPPQMKTRNQK